MAYLKSASVHNQISSSLRNDQMNLQHKRARKVQKQKNTEDKPKKKTKKIIRNIKIKQKWKKMASPTKMRKHFSKFPTH